jgi:hypothetical protein
MWYNIIKGDGYMKPIAIEVREIIVAAKEQGEKPETIALWVGC